MKVDLAKTKAYYQALKEESLCNCEPCKQYYLNARAFLPDLALWLDDNGVQIEKPFEVMSIALDESNEVCYLSIQYVLFGVCPKDFSFSHGDFEIQLANSHPSTEISEAHFVIEVFSIASLGFSLED